MDKGTVPEVERRKKENGMVSHVAETLIGKQSRKVAFGVWGFIASNAFLSTGKISEKIWWEVFLTCAVLIGCGTILDDVLSKLGDKVAGIAASKITTVTKVETESVNASTPS